MLFRIFAIVSVFCGVLHTCLATNLSQNDSANDGYFLEEFDGHKIHLLIIDPAKYEMKLISSHNSVFGRRTVDEIVASIDGDIGVNAGFFEIGKNYDGMPSGALVIDGKFYGMQAKKLPCIIQQKDRVTIEDLQPKLDVSIAGKNLKIDQFNKFVVNKNIYIYNDVWGSKTLSPYDTRQEIVIDRENIIVALNNHGNSAILAGGHVISLPKADKGKFDNNIVGTKVKLNWQPQFIDNKQTSLVLGIPRLIKNGKIVEGLNKTAANARTAFGLTKDGHYIIVVVEHFNMPDMKNLTLNDIGLMLKDEEVKADNLSVAEVKKYLRKKMTANATIVGFTTQQLAEYMQKKGCVSAINLDGGGSSSLYMNGKFVNTAFGDIDEAKGMQVHRAVSNALVFKKRGGVITGCSHADNTT